LRQLCVVLLLAGVVPLLDVLNECNSEKAAASAPFITGAPPGIDYAADGCQYLTGLL